MSLHMHSRNYMTEVPGWPLPQKVLVYRCHFYLQGLLMGISSNLTIFLGFLAWSFITVWHGISFFPFFSSFPYTLSSCLFLSPSCLSWYCLIWWWAVVARYRRKKKRLWYETTIPMSQESYMANKEQVGPWEFVSLPLGCCCVFVFFFFHPVIFTSLS